MIEKKTEEEKSRVEIKGERRKKKTRQVGKRTKREATWMVQEGSPEWI